MSAIQEHLDASATFDMREIKYSFDYETPAKLAIEVAKNASPYSTGKEILEKLREAVSKSATRRSSENGSSVTVADGKSLVIFNDKSSHKAPQLSAKSSIQTAVTDTKENHLAVQRGISVKERMKQSIAQRRTALKEKSLNLQSNNSIIENEQVSFEKKSSKGRDEVQIHVERVPTEDAKPTYIEEVSIQIGSLELNTLEDDEVIRSSVENKASSMNFIEQVKEENADDYEDEEPTFSECSQYNSTDCCVSVDHRTSHSIAGNLTDLKTSHGIIVDREELLSTSGKCVSIASDCSSSADEFGNTSISPDSCSKENVKNYLKSPLEHSKLFEDASSANYSLHRSSQEEIISCHSSPFSIGGTIIPDVLLDGSVFDPGSPFMNLSSVKSKGTTLKRREYEPFEKVAECSPDSTHDMNNTVCGPDAYLDDVVSPVSKLLVAGLPPSNGNDSYVVSRSTASSLIERNKTLMKEVRFADQTCVELSERNACMRRDMELMKKDLIASNTTNEDLHRSLVRSSTICAKLEEERDFTKIRMEEEKLRFEMQIETLKQNLEAEQKRNSVLNEKLEDKSKALVLAEKKLVSVSAAYKVLHEERNDAKKRVAELTDRLFHLQSNEEENEKSLNQVDLLQTKVQQLEKTANDRLLALEREREVNKVEQADVESMKSKFSPLDNGLHDGSNSSFSSSGSALSSFAYSTEIALCNKLSNAKLECEEYKRILDEIIQQIKTMQKFHGISESEKVLSESGSGSMKLLCIAQDLASTCAAVNIAAADRINLLEERNNFLTQSISRLQDMCSEDSFRVPGSFDIESKCIANSSPTTKNSFLDLCEKNEIYESVISSMKNELLQLQRQYDESIKELTELREVFEYTENCLSDEQIKSRELEGNLRKCKAKIEESSDELKQSDSLLTLKDNQIELLQHQISALNDQMDFIRDEFIGQRNDYIVQLESKENELLLRSNELDKCLSELDIEKKLRLDAEESQRSLYSDNEILSDKLSNTTSELNIAKTKITSLTNELNHFQCTFRSMETKQREAAANFASRIEESHQNLVLLQDSLCEKDAQLVKAQSDIDSLMQENSEMIIDTARRIEAKQEIIVSISARLKEYEKKYQDLLDDQRDTKSVDDSMVSEKDALIFKLQRRNESLDRKRLRLREYVKNLNSRCCEWEESFHEHNSETHNIREKYNEAVSQIQELVQQIGEQKKIDTDMKCEDCKYLRRALVMESIAASKHKSGNESK